MQVLLPLPQSTSTTSHHKRCGLVMPGVLLLSCLRVLCGLQAFMYLVMTPEVKARTLADVSDSVSLTSPIQEYACTVPSHTLAVCARVHRLFQIGSFGLLYEPCPHPCPAHPAVANSNSSYQVTNCLLTRSSPSLQTASLCVWLTLVCVWVLQPGIFFVSPVCVTACGPSCSCAQTD